MQFLLSLDYELFFGSRVGTVQKCLIDPVTALLGELVGKGLRLSFFVDAGFLVRLREEGARYPHLQAEYDLIRKHLSQLKSKGHDIQLHIHPHWIDSHYDGNSWKINTTRYKLHDFTKNEMADIVRDYKAELVNIAGEQIFAYRGGGWCIQPFNEIAGALLAENIWLESTVFYQGKSEDSKRGYDFSGAPDLDYWRFADDPVKQKETGPFLEVPIGSLRVNPSFFWRLALAKKIGGAKYKSYGDGSAMVADKGYYFSRLTKSSHSVVSIDGMKAGLLNQAYQQLQHTGGKDLFHVMGHPKALTPCSVKKLSQFIDQNAFDFITFQNLSHL